MEASEKPQLAFEGEAPGGGAAPIGDRNLAKEDRYGDDHLTGFARLHLMVSTVFERLTSP